MARTATKDESTLTDRQRQVLHLTRDEGMDREAVARAMGITPSAVSDHVSRLRKRGHLPKRRRGGRGGNTNRASGQRTGRTRSSGRTARVGKQDGNVAFDHVPSLPKAMDEIEGRMTAITEEQGALTERQQALAEEQAALTEQQNKLSGEAANLGRVREGITGALTPA